MNTPEQLAIGVDELWELDDLDKLIVKYERALQFMGNKAAWEYLREEADRAHKSAPSEHTAPMVVEAVTRLTVNNLLAADNLAQRLVSQSRVISE